MKLSFVMSLKCTKISYISVSYVNGDMHDPSIFRDLSLQCGNNNESCETKTFCETSSESCWGGKKPKKPKSGVLKRFDYVMRRIFSSKL